MSTLRPRKLRFFLGGGGLEASTDRNLKGCVYILNGRNLQRNQNLTVTCEVLSVHHDLAIFTYFFDVKLLFGLLKHSVQ